MLHDLVTCSVHLPGERQQRAPEVALDEVVGRTDAIECGQHDDIGFLKRLGESLGVRPDGRPVGGSFGEGWRLGRHVDGLWNEATSTMTSSAMSEKDRDWRMPMAIRQHQ